MRHKGGAVAVVPGVGRGWELLCSEHFGMPSGYWLLASSYSQGLWSGTRQCCDHGHGIWSSAAVFEWLRPLLLMLLPGLFLHGLYVTADLQTLWTSGQGRLLL